jgi:hypothetical protein
VDRNVRILGEDALRTTDFLVQEPQLIMSRQKVVEMFVFLITAGFELRRRTNVGVIGMLQGDGFAALLTIEHPAPFAK